MVHHGCLIAALVGFCMTFSHAQISEIISIQEIGNYKSLALTALSHPKTLSDTFYATQILKSVKASGFSCNCASIAKMISQATSNLVVYYGVMTSESCGCTAGVSEAIKTSAMSGLKVFSTT